MKNFYLFEWIKLTKRAKLKLILPLIFCLTFGMFWLNHSQNIKQIDFLMEYRRERIRSDEDYLKLDHLTPTDIKGMNEILEFNKKMMEIMENGTESEKIQVQIEDWERPIEGLIYSIGAENGTSLPSVVMEKTLEELYILKDKEISPDFPLTSILPETIIDNYSKIDLDAYYQVNGQRRYDQGWLSLYGFFKNHGHYIIYVLVVILFGASMTIEKSPKNNHLSFLKQQGITKSKLINIKLLVSMMWIFILLLIGFLAVLLSSTIFSKIGSLDYPILEYYFPSIMQSITYRWMPLWKYLLQAIALLVVSIFFILSLCFTVGQLFNSSFVLWLFAFFTLGLSFLLPAEQWNPLYYLNIHQVVSGIGKYYANQDFLTVNKGILLLLGSSIILLLGNYLLQKGQKNEENNFIRNC